ncbi:MAG TPA: metallophosphoesterase [Bacilli bacterium]|nr:metallophosphoesterase [Bacilli bacterium]
MKDKKVYYLTELFFVMVMFVLSYIIVAIYKNSFSLFIFGLGFIANITGYIGFFLSLINQEIGRKSEVVSCFITVIFCLIYSSVEPTQKNILLILAIITLIIFVMLKTIIRKKTFIKEPKEVIKEGKYLKLSGSFLLIIIFNILLIIGIMIFPFEKNMNIFEEPNGGGLSSYISDSKNSSLAVNIDGGFIYNIDTTRLKKLTDEGKSTKDLIGILDFKLTNPQANIKLNTYSKGNIIINLYNYYSGSELYINGEKAQLTKKNSNISIYEDVKVPNNNIIKNLIKNSYLNTINHYYLKLAVDINKEYNIEIKQVENEERNWSFYTISDLHGGINVAVPAIKNIVRNKPDFIIAAGDIVNTGSESEYIVMNNLFASSPVPIYPVIGNHDVWGNGGRYYSYFFGPYYYSFKYKNATLIFLDTSSGIIGDAQFQWFENELKKVNTDLIFVFSHTPPINPTTGLFDSYININSELSSSIQSKAESDKIVSLCKEYKVDYFVSAHIHRYDHKAINGTTYITSGVLGGAAVNTKNIGFLKFSVDNNKVTYEFVKDKDEYNEGLLIHIQTIQVFLIPVLRSCGIRLLIISIILIMDYILWMEFKNRLIYIKK